MLGRVSSPSLTPSLSPSYLQLQRVQRSRHGGRLAGRQQALGFGGHGLMREQKGMKKREKALPLPSLPLFTRQPWG